MSSSPPGDTLDSAGGYVEVNLEKQPSDGEVLLFTTGGGFVIKGSVKDIAKRLMAEDWPEFELAESGDSVVVRSNQVVALRGGSRTRKGSIGFSHRE
jgi:hypothetical protein